MGRKKQPGWFLFISIACFIIGFFHVIGVSEASALQITQVHNQAHSWYFWGIFFILIYYGEAILIAITKRDSLIG